MRIRKVFSAIASAVLALQLLCVNLSAQSSPGNVTNIAVAPQYDTTHVYVAREDFDRFVGSLVATFGARLPSKEFSVTPTPSSTMSQVLLTPVGTLSVFGFKTPVPYPLGAERTGYVVTDMDTAIQAAPRRALMCLAPCSTIPSGEPPLSNDYGIFCAGKS